MSEMSSMSDTALDALLRRAAGSVTYPATPDIRAGVMARITAREPAPAAVAPVDRARPFAFAALVVAAITAAAVLAVPGSRSAVADFFGIQGSEVDVLPTPAPGTTPTPLPTPVGIEEIARPSTLADAGRAAGLEPALPAGAGEPEAVWLVRFIETDAVVLEYAEFDLWESTLPAGFFQKGLPDGTTLRDHTVNGVPARWISGGTHIVRFIGANGREAAGSQRTVERNTMIWRSAYAFYRLETDLPFEEALRIAESLP